MDLSSLTLQQLRYIVAIDRERSFREAARACHVSQPALSAQVKRAEEILDVVVFDRTRQPVVVTERGALVLAHARVVVDQVDKLATFLDGGPEHAGSFRLGIIPSLASTVVPLFLPRFVETYPHVELEIVEAKTEDLVRRLRDGALDAGIAALPLGIPSLTERVLFHETFYAYLSPGHALASRARIRQSDLVDEAVWLLREGHCFRTQALHLCSVDARSCRPSMIRFDADSFDTLVRLVDAGIGVTVLPELVVRSLPSAKRVNQVRPFVTPEPVRAIGMLVAREELRRSTNDALFRTLRSVLPKDIQTRTLRRSVVVPP